MARATQAADEHFMRRALRLAVRGQGYVEPNPMVGCVIVKAGRIVGEGWHRRFGGPHAEVEALRRCRVSPRGATVYVTLEPCCYFGKTPPCTDALIAAGVSRIVAAMRDPNPRIAGRGIRQLRAAGIAVETGLLEAQARRLNAPFIKLMTQRRPWVILKWAQSLDGKIATRTGNSKWISDAAARRHAHGTRARIDAILVGANTVLTDDPLLTCRHVPPRRIATRIVLDSMLRTPLGARLVRSARRVPTWIFHDRRAPRSRRDALLAKGCRLFGVPTTRGRISLPLVLHELGQAGMTNLLVEGGGTLLGSFLDHGLANEVNIYVAPILIGGARAISALSAIGPRLARHAFRFADTPVLAPIGGGWLASGRLRLRPGVPNRS